jgi:hypothetical protein
MLQEIPAQPTIKLNVGYLNVWTTIAGTDLGHHVGWNVGADARWLFAIPVQTRKQESTSAIVSILCIPEIRTQFSSISASNWLSDGSRYRAWNASAFGPELSLGLNIHNFDATLGQTILLSGAFLENFCHYTDTTLYAAYTSWRIGLLWNLELNRKWMIGLDIPIEFATRADGQSIIAGVALGARYAL